MELKDFEGMTGDDLLEYFSEVELDNDDLEEGAKEVEDESQTLAEETSTDRPVLSKYNNVDLHKLALKTSLQRAAFDQSEINVYEPLDRSELKRLIELLTEKLKAHSLKYENKINLHVAKLLSKHIPWQIRKLYADYPMCVRRSSGFLYRATQDGVTKVFFVHPDVPYYFEQGTEMEFLRAVYPDMLSKIDKWVFCYYNAQTCLIEREVSIATALSRRRMSTYFDLLKYNVRWFDVLYKDKTGKSLIDK